MIKNILKRSYSTSERYRPSNINYSIFNTSRSIYLNNKLQNNINSFKRINFIDNKYPYLKFTLNDMNINTNTKQYKNLLLSYNNLEIDPYLETDIPIRFRKYTLYNIKNQKGGRWGYSLLIFIKSENSVRWGGFIRSNQSCTIMVRYHVHVLCSSCNALHPLRTGSVMCV